MIPLVYRILLLPALLLAAGCSDDTKPAKPDLGLADSSHTDGSVLDGCARVASQRATCQQALATRFDQSAVVAKGCYRANVTPVIGSGVTVTLSPGVTIIFAQKTGLSFSADQILAAAGTAQDPICLTGDQPQRGFWKGISFDGTLKPDSKLDYVTVEHAGNTDSDKDAAALKLTADSRGVRASITNTTIRESQGWGLYLGGSAVIGAFSKNTLTKNTLGPAKLASEVVSVLDAASTYKGNNRDELVVAAYRTKGTWAAIDVPYYLEGGIGATGDWTIEAGNTLIMSKETEVTISTDTSALIAKGTATNPILFTGATKQRGAWKGITFDNSNNTRNALAYATVEYAGDTTHDTDAAAVKLTADSHGVQLSMTQTKLHESLGWGLYLAGSAVLPSFTGNTMTKNTLGPVSADSEATYQLLPASTYSGNDVDRVVVRGQWASKSVTWQDLKVPYLLQGSLRPTNQSVLTIAPGVTLIMGKGAWISVGQESGAAQDNGLHAVGTPSQPITITGLEKTAGYWESIVFDGTLNGANALDYCTIEYGGGGAAKGWGGMIVASSDSHGVAVSIANSKIQNSAVYGVWQGKWASVELTGTTFASCASGDVYHQP
jgi:hypothetical protein